MEMIQGGQKEIDDTKQQEKKCRSEAVGTLRTDGISKHGESDCFGYKLVQVIMPNYCSPVEGEYGKFEQVSRYNMVGEIG